MELELAVEQLPGLPPNATLHHTTVDLAQLRARPADEHMIARLIATCAHSIAQKHQHVRAVIREVTDQFQGVPLLEYVITLRMPLSVRISYESLSELKLIQPERVHQITVFYEEECLGLEIRVDSNDNPGDIESFTVTHTTLRRARPRNQRIVSEEAPEHETRGSTKRVRHNAPQKPV